MGAEHAALQHQQPIACAFQDAKPAYWCERKLEIEKSRGNIWTFDDVVFSDEMEPHRWIGPGHFPDHGHDHDHHHDGAPPPPAPSWGPAPARPPPPPAPAIPHPLPPPARAGGSRIQSSRPPPPADDDMSPKEASWYARRDAANCVDGPIPEFARYGLTCADWAMELGGIRNGEPDCYHADWDHLLNDNWTPDELDAVVTACPKTCHPPAEYEAMCGAPHVACDDIKPEKWCKKKAMDSFRYPDMTGATFEGDSVKGKARCTWKWFSENCAGTCW